MSWRRRDTGMIVPASLARRGKRARVWPSTAGQRHRVLSAVASLVAAVCVACASGDRAGGRTGTAWPSPAAPSATAATPTPRFVAASPTATPAPSQQFATAAAGESVTISAVGDISLARQLVDRMEEKGAGYPFQLVAPLIDGDIGFANLEGALTQRGEAWPKGYNFRTPPDFASGLADAGFSVVTVANNHTMDYGPVGLVDTIEALDTAGVRHAGAGVNALAAQIPAIVNVGGLRVAFLGYAATPDESGGFSLAAWAAGETSPGIALGTSDRIAADVTAARRVADFVIVAVHAGDEYVNAPNDKQRELAQAALAAGADAYIGAHAHVVQPVELRGRQLIAWGLGNFVFDLDPVDLANIPAPRLSLILDITLTKGAGVTAFRAIPVTLDDAEDRPRPATPDEAAVLQRLIDSGDGRWERR